MNRVHQQYSFLVCLFEIRKFCALTNTNHGLTYNVILTELMHLIRHIYW